jgi:hypothetical protein
MCRYAEPVVDNNGDGCADVSKFSTIPTTFWFVVATMTTVGYGDYVPITVTGKIIAMIAAFGGILTLALPTTVISHDFGIVCTEFEEEEAKREKEEKGKEDDDDSHGAQTASPCDIASRSSSTSCPMTSISPPASFGGAKSSDGAQSIMASGNGPKATSPQPKSPSPLLSSAQSAPTPNSPAGANGAAAQRQVPTTPPNHSMSLKFSFGSALFEDDLDEYDDEGRKKKFVPKNIRDRMWLTVDDPNFSKIAYIFAVFISVLIVLSTVAFVLESVPELYHLAAWKDIEIVCVTAFAAEYFSRLLICPTWTYLDRSSCYFVWLKPEKHDTDIMVAEILARGRFVLQPMNIVDVLAIFPVIVEWYVSTATLGVAAGALVDLRAIRLTRVFRLFKMMKYVEGMQLVSKTLSRSWRMLRSLIFLLMIVVLVCASVMYFAERGKFFYCSKEAVQADLCHLGEIRDMTFEGHQPLEDCMEWANKGHTAEKEQTLLCCYGAAW